MKNTFTDGILKKLFLFSNTCRHMKAFYEHFPQQNADYGAYASKMSLLQAFANQRTIRSLPKDARNRDESLVYCIENNRKKFQINPIIRAEVKS